MVFCRAMPGKRRANENHPDVAIAAPAWWHLQGTATCDVLPLLFYVPTRWSTTCKVLQTPQFATATIIPSNALISISPHRLRPALHWQWRAPQQQALGGAA